MKAINTHVVHAEMAAIQISIKKCEFRGKVCNEYPRSASAANKLLIKLKDCCLSL